MKTRADILLAEQGLCESREQAKRLILAGKVRVGTDRVIQKASEMLDGETVLNIEENSPYVSRGAYKLLPALEKHLPDMTGLVCLDVGASTGGFTDLMLQRGASKVYAVDVGTAQLHSKLRSDPRVISRENVNARYLDESSLPEKADVVTMDISFISVMKVLPAANRLLKSDGLAFILVKPQFEAGRKDVEKGGVVRNEAVRMRCVTEVVSFAKNELSYSLVEVIPSPILGPKGNQEFMAIFLKGSSKI
jgi:23S rRNA (cytidine1920-2'-O)/16S rRNA (cytidine1409-2'-O)-methyltransferase